MTLPSPPLALGTTGAFYLGKPTAMQTLRTPDAGYAANGSRGESVMTLLSGGTVVTRLPDVKRVWSLPFSGMTMDSASLLMAFYQGAMGVGPFNLVDPAWRNVLNPDIATMGAKLGALSGWATSGAGTISWSDGATSSPAVPFPMTDVLVWAGAGSSSKLAPAASWSGSNAVPDVNIAPVYLFAVPSAATIYARTASGTASVTYSANGVNASGVTQQAGAVSTTATLSSAAWTRLTAIIGSNSTTASYVQPQLACNTASAPSILLCCADVQYGPLSVAATGAWVMPFGSPRVVIAPASSGFSSTFRLLPYRDQAMQFNEV